MVMLEANNADREGEPTKVPSFDVYVSQRRTATATCNGLLRLFGEPELTCDELGRVFTKES